MHEHTKPEVRKFFTCECCSSINAWNYVLHKKNITNEERINCHECGGLAAERSPEEQSDLDYLKAVNYYANR